MHNKYVNEFLSLNSAPDILSAVKINHGLSKEISEAMSIKNRMKKLTLADKMKYDVTELCAGNLLLSTILAFTQPITCVTAIDIRKRDQDFSHIKKFKYVQQNIYENEVYDHITENTIIVSVHPCKKLAERVIQVWFESKSQHLYMMPCCSGTITNVPQSISAKIGGYQAWCLDLFYKTKMCEGRYVDLVFDNHCISPCNGIIIANK